MIAPAQSYTPRAPVASDAARAAGGVSRCASPATSSDRAAGALTSTRVAGGWMLPAAGTSSGVVVSLCDKTGNMVRPWARAGFRVVTVDIDGPAGEVEHNRTAWRHDVLAGIPDLGPVAIVFAFPSCTHLAASGARWFRDKGLSALIDALRLVEACRVYCEASGAPWMIENPVGTLSTYWREPDYRFDPVHYAGYEGGAGDLYTKKTCLWTGGGFVMPDRKPGEPSLGSLMHRLPPSADRADIRSATPAGFAQAVFEANAPRLLREAA